MTHGNLERGWRAVAVKGLRGLPPLALVAIVACGPTIQSGLQDAQISMDVRTALVNDPELGAESISIEVRGGNVRLTGRVRSADLVARAERVARGVSGVRDVTTEIDVGPPEVVGRDYPGRLPSIPGQDPDRLLRLVAVGAGGTLAAMPDRAVDNGVGVGPIIRLRPRNGWGPSVGFSWTTTKLGDSPGGAPGLATLAVRPVMAGLEYGVLRGRVASAVSLVGGYSFNSLAVDASRSGPGRAIGVDNGPALRAGVSVWVDVTPRVGLNLFGGYRMTRPLVTFASDAAVEKRRVNADAVLFGLGFAYWIF